PLPPVGDRRPDRPSARGQGARTSAALARLAAVRAVTASNVPPTNAPSNLPAAFGDGRGTPVQYRMVTPGYADVMGMPLLAGRMIDSSDVAGSEPVAVVSAAFARAYLEGEALGKTVRMAM